MTDKSVIFVSDDLSWCRAVRESPVFGKYQFRIVSDNAHAIALISDPTALWHLVVTGAADDDLREAVRQADPSLRILIVTSGAARTASLLVELESAIKRAFET